MQVLLCFSSSGHSLDELLFKILGMCLSNFQFTFSAACSSAVDSFSSKLVMAAFVSAVCSMDIFFMVSNLASKSATLWDISRPSKPSDVASATSSKDFSEKSWCLAGGFSSTSPLTAAKMSFRERPVPKGRRCPTDAKAASATFKCPRTNARSSPRVPQSQKRLEPTYWLWSSETLTCPVPRNGMRSYSALGLQKVQGFFVSACHGQCKNAFLVQLRLVSSMSSNGKKHILWCFYQRAIAHQYLHRLTSPQTSIAAFFPSSAVELLSPKNSRLQLPHPVKSVIPAQDFLKFTHRNTLGFPIVSHEPMTHYLPPHAPQK